MKSIKLCLIVVGSVSLLFLAACNSGSQPDSSSSNQAGSSKVSEPESSSSTATEKTEPNGESKGSQVVESGDYHLEFVPEKADSGTHLDLYLQRGDNHEAIANAKVMAQIQLPDGTQNNLDLNYDAEGKHYTALLPGKATGRYQVKMTAEVNGEKADGRFSFNQ